MSDESNPVEEKFIPTEQDIRFKFLLKYFQVKTAYALEVTWFHIHHNTEISLPLILFMSLSNKIDPNMAIVYCSIPSFFFLLVGIFVYRLYEPMSYLLIMSFYLQMVFNYTATQPQHYPCHQNWIIGIIGLQFLLSIPFTKTTVFYMIQPWSTINHPVRVAEWHSNWQYEMFRKTFRVLTGVMGTGFILQAVLSYVLSLYLSVSALKIVCPIISAVTVVGLLGWMVVYSKIQQKKGDELRAKRQMNESQTA